MTDAELKRLRELSEAKHLDGCSGFGKRCKACEFNSIARLAVPKLLAHLAGLEMQYWDLNRGNLKLLRNWKKAETEGADARADVERLLNKLEFEQALVEKLNTAIAGDGDLVARSEVELAEQERDEARANTERFRASNYELEELVCTRRTERDEARAEVERLKGQQNNSYRSSWEVEND